MRTGLCNIYDTNRDAPQLFGTSVWTICAQGSVCYIRIQGRFHSKTLFSQPMEVFDMRYLLIIGLLVSTFSITVQSNPKCQTDSDPDGDGWGWENNVSCVVSNSVPVISECIDSDGDGWGWNGVRSCIPEQQEPVDVGLPIAQDPVCVDTGIIGDTWGWNGIQPCRVAPVLTGGNTRAIAGLWDDSDAARDIVRYMEISANGLRTLYVKIGPFADCFFVTGGMQTSEGSAITPLGENQYRVDSYSIESLVDLERTSYIASISVSSTGSLMIEQPDVEDRDEDNDLDEIITLDLRPATGIDVNGLSICALL